MANSFTSPNMSLTIPSPGIDPGPDWANNLNASLVLIDAHDHSPGKGVRITPAGINITAPLTFNINDATSLRSVRFNPFSSMGAFGATAFDIGCLFEVSPDLYYIDGNGNTIRITQSGSVNATGNITGLGGFPNAGVNYNGFGTFVFSQNTNVAANVDVASIILRNTTFGSNSYTVNPPAAMAANYSITLPVPPGGTSFLTMDPSGVIGFGSVSNSNKWTLNDAVVPYKNIDGPIYIINTISLSSIFISILNSGRSGSTVVQLNQYRAGAFVASATASITASGSNPITSVAALSGSLALLAGDLVTVDINSIATGNPEAITVEF